MAEPLIDAEIPNADLRSNRPYRMIVEIDNGLDLNLGFEAVEEERTDMVILRIRIHQEHWDYVKKNFDDYVAEGHPHYTIEEHVFANYHL